MNEIHDDRFDERDENQPLGNDAVIQKAKAKTSTVGTMMILASLVMFLVSFVMLYITLGSGIDLNLMMLEKMKGWNQDARFQADMQQQIDLRKNLDPNVKMMENVMNGGFGVLGLVANSLVLMAGIFMKSLKAYVLCIIGCIASFMLNGCCCIGLPIGIWALVVLVNSDVKAGFAAMKRRSQFAN